jgi:uncharacterized protein YciI
MVLLPVLTAALFAQPVQLPKPNYCFGFLKAAPNRPDRPKEELERIQAAHIGHLTKLAEERWLVAAGPMGTPGEIRGVAISKCASVDEAVEKGAADPAVKAGRLAVEAYAWTGPDGIGDGYWKRRAENPNAPEKMVKHALVLIRKGPGWTEPTTETLRAHLKHMESEKKNGLAAMGPFHDSPEILGVAIYRNTALEEARRRVAADPMFANRTTLDVLEWWCAEAVLPD